MAKKDKETLSEDAHRWRSTAALLQPPISESEMIQTIHLYPREYYSRLCGAGHTTFASLVKGEEGIKNGWIVEQSKIA